METRPLWMEKLITTRVTMMEVELARVYANKFGHGTDGHNRLLIIAKMADFLDAIEAAYPHIIREIIDES